MTTHHLPKVAGISSSLPRAEHTNPPSPAAGSAQSSAHEPLAESENIRADPGHPDHRAPASADAPHTPYADAPTPVEQLAAAQDRLAGWISDLTTLHELTEGLVRATTLEEALHETLRGGAVLVGAQRGLIVLAPADGLGPDRTLGLGLGRADIGQIETVTDSSAFYGRLLEGLPEPGRPEEISHPDIAGQDELDPRHREVAARLGYAASYAVPLHAAPLRPAPGPDADPALASAADGAVESTGATGSTDTATGPTAPTGPSSATPTGAAAHSTALPPEADTNTDTATGTSRATDDVTLSDEPPAAPGPPPAPSPDSPVSPDSSAGQPLTPLPSRPSGPPPLPVHRVPVPNGAGGRLGAVVWLYDEPAAPTERQRHLLGLYLQCAAEHLARRLSLFRAESALAAVQEELLPARLPRVPGVRLAVRHFAGPHGGGDWYDVLPLPEAALGLSVGGVTGSGPGAVAAMGRLRASLRAYAVMEGEDPVAVLSDLELLMRLTEPARSATALFGYAEPASRKIVIAGAGHCPPLIVGPRRCEFVETTLSAPLGMLACWEAPSVEVRPEAGETLLLYTDGLLRRTGESMDRAFSRLHSAASTAAPDVRDDPDALVDHVLHKVLGRQRCEEPHPEDVVLLAARF
ncbi:SpoIIE family protein phosphatase [Streptomyces sp. XM4193]|nr:SpoIIE family protein phosphatase [Streptomyces sp. XM4193]MCK1794719.1 SpoIIE family protein phosphatase [Streptomyces sp. XM4193]